MQTTQSQIPYCNCGHPENRSICDRWDCYFLPIGEIEDHSGYYQGPLGVETDQPQEWSKPLILILTASGALFVWAAIWFIIVAIIHTI